jgi:hypothetical protein
LVLFGSIAIAKLVGAWAPGLRLGTVRLVQVAPEFGDQNSPVTLLVAKSTTPTASAPPGALATFNTVWLPAEIVPPLCAAPNTCVHVPPVSLLTKSAVLALVPAVGELTDAKSLLVLLGSPTIELTAPSGNPVPATPDTNVNVAPPSVLRYNPPTLCWAAEAANDVSKVPATIVFPRAATPSTVWPDNVAAPSEVHVALPSWEYNSPFRKPPEPVKKHEPVEQTVPLALRPVPAISVLRLGSVGSKARLAIEVDACLSVSGVQVVPPLVVSQMPPAGVPAKNLLGFTGSAITGPTAPATPPFGGASPLWTVFVGPTLAAGPCVTNV